MTEDDAVRKIADAGLSADEEARLRRMSAEGRRCYRNRPRRRPRWVVIYHCNGVPYGRYYERWGWIARRKAKQLAKDPYYENVIVKEL